MGAKCQQARGARAILGWTLLWLIAAHVITHVYLETCRPNVYDPEFGARFALLGDRLAESPDRPLLLVVGSSRLVTDFVPEALPPLSTADGAGVLPFNFGHTGAGPLVNLMEVRRLLRAGIRPRWLVVEILPAMLNTSGCSTAIGLAVADDLPLLRTHMPAWKAYGGFLLTRLTPRTRHYLAALREQGPFGALFPTIDDFADLTRLGSSAPVHADASADELIRLTQVVRSQYQPGLQNFRVTNVAQRSLRETIELCRAHEVELIFVVTPESSEFRSWYTRRAARKVDDYCERLRGDFGIPVIDARTWLADEDFYDGHHLSARGAERFTRRLGKEVLRPWVSGQLSAISLQPSASKRTADR